MTTTDDPLVSTEWLAAHLNDPNVKIIDATFKLPGVMPLPKDDFLAAHLPGAVFFDVNAIVRSFQPAAAHVSERRAIRARCRRARHLQRRYGRGLRFRRLGRRAAGVVDVPVVRPCHVRMLDGGLKKWRAEGRPVESGEVTPKPAKFQATSIRGASAASSNCSAIRKPDRAGGRRARRDRFEGTVAEPWPGLRSGHIPGSRNVPYAELFDAGTGAMKPLDDLRTAFAGAGVTRYADRDQLRLRRLAARADAGAVSPRRRGNALYDGSWAEWGAADGPPIATGPA